MLDSEWRTSARSQDTNCVEVAYADGEVLVRDTKNREGPTLCVAVPDWLDFIAAVKDGEFDRD
jgi:uncharacterized protein DUF397